MLRIKKQNGQTVMEYAILLIIVMASLVAAGAYLKRGIQGRWKSTVDELGEQYDPSVMVSNIRHTLDISAESRITTQNGAGGFWTMRTDTSNSVEQKTGNSTVGAY